MATADANAISQIHTTLVSLGFKSLRLSLSVMV
jgi:hypothetical protein